MTGRGKDEPETRGSLTIRAESIFADWIDRRQSGKAEPLEALCDAHPELAERLRCWFGVLIGLDELLEPAQGAGEAPPEPAPVAPDDPQPARPATDLVHGPTRALFAALLADRVDAGKYERGGELGKGGMGLVEEVFEPRLRRALARKRILTQSRGGRVPDSGPGYEWALTRFLEEAQVTAQLTHPGVVPVHELAVDDSGDVYFTMDRVGGEELARAFTRHRKGDEAWSLTRLVGVLVRVCETMAFAHSRGVVHRDLKPGNVMLGEFGEVYVMDWGLARVLDPEAVQGLGRRSDTPPVVSVRRESDDGTESPFLTREGETAGTPGYLAPEQARGDLSRIDRRTDEYAVGTMLYELLAGTRPYEDQGALGRNAVVAVLREDATPLEQLAPEAPAELVAICEKAMQREPRDRYPDLGAMATDLRAWLEGRVVAAYESGAWAEAKKWVRRNRGLAAAIAATLVALFAGVSGMLVVEAAGRRRVETEKLVTQLTEGPQVVSGLLAEERELWPATPETLPELRHWVERADTVLAEWGFYVEGQRALRDGEEGTRFEAAELSSTLLPSVERMLGSHGRLQGVRERVTARAGIAETLREISVDGEGARQAWAAAIAAIKSSPRYGGLELTPQLGLFPVGANEESGLWEFWHVASGARPSEALDSGRWRTGPDTGIVLVLVPGGEATIGSVAYLPDGSNAEQPFVDRLFNFDVDDERPLRQVELSPFFLSKYELTNAQWSRAIPEAPPLEEAGEVAKGNLTREQALAVAHRFDLMLPTEARWEYACRAGSTSVFSQPDEPNFDPRPFLTDPNNEDLYWELQGEAVDWCRSFAVLGLGRTAVGRLLPNPWGLHDVHGNVWEWVRDDYWLASEPSASMRPKDGGQSPRAGEHGDTMGLIRGGGYDPAGAPQGLRSAARMPLKAAYFDNDVGVRLARSIRP